MPLDGCNCSEPEAPGPHSPGLKGGCGGPHGFTPGLRPRRREGTLGRRAWLWQQEALYSSRVCRNEESGWGPRGTSKQLLQHLAHAALRSQLNLSRWTSLDRVKIPCNEGSCLSPGCPRTPCPVTTDWPINPHRSLRPKYLILMWVLFAFCVVPPSHPSVPQHLVIKAPSFLDSLQPDPAIRREMRH